MIMEPFLLLLLFFLAQADATQQGLPSLALPDCPERCGSLRVPYPFGIQDGCSRNDTDLLLTCDNYNSSVPPRLLLTIGTNYSCEIPPFVRPPRRRVPLKSGAGAGARGAGVWSGTRMGGDEDPDHRLKLSLPAGLRNSTCLSQVEVTDITFDNLTINYTRHIARNCGDDQQNPTIFDLGDRPYTFSTSRNNLAVTGCNTLGLFSVANGSYTGCLSFCQNNTIRSPGEGCCQIALRNGTKRLETSVFSVEGLTATGAPINRSCGAAFAVEKEWFERESSAPERMARSGVPVVLEWVVGNKSCAVASRSPGFACVGGVGAECVDVYAESGGGYKCRCKPGYEGSPYLQGGCKDVNECTKGTHDCMHSCKNTEGNYTCSCPKGEYGDGRKTGTGCNKNNKRFPVAAIIITCIGVSVMILVLTISSLRWIKHRRDYTKLKQDYFRKNGGLLLCRDHTTGREAVRIFSEEELKAATGGFSEKQVLGRGANGEVYRGVVQADKMNTVVAIKKSTKMEQKQIEEFVNEIRLLSELVHRNVVKLVGCCLETQIPLLVYEYVPYGTLYQHIHEAGFVASFSWPARVKIAAETAGAIAYLHSALARPIIHRDIKSANILIDSELTAKVADFGASRLAPLNEQEEATMVLGTRGYLDPEYFETGFFSDKSDVYSFGIVLAELLTGRKAIWYTEEGVQSLSTYLQEALKDGSLHDILDARMDGDCDLQQAMGIAYIARRCMARRQDKRPTMRQVAAELEVLRGGAEQQQGDGGGDERYVGRHVRVNKWSGSTEEVSTETSWSTSTNYSRLKSC